MKNSSISKKLTVAVLVIASLFLLQLLGVYLASQRVRAGMSDLHQQQQLSDALTALHQITDSLSEIPGGAGKSNDESARLFDGEFAQATLKLRQAQALSQPYLDYSVELKNVSEALEQLDQAIRRYFRTAPSPGSPSPDAERELLLARQFGLDATETQDKLKLLIQSRSNELFSAIYRIRYFPLFVALALTLLFTLFALAGGLMLRRQLDDSIGNLLTATHEVARGRLDFQAPILSSDEIGMLTHAFNSMIRELQLSTVSREYVEAIIQSLPDALFVLSPDGEIQRVNRAAILETGRDSEFLVKQSMGSFFEPAGMDFRQEFRDVETGLLNGSGDLIPVSVAASAIRDKEGRVSGIACVVTDLRERKEFEVERRRMEEVQHILSDASQLLSESIDYERTLQHIHEIIVPRLGDCSFIHLPTHSEDVQAMKFVCADPKCSAVMKEAGADELSALRKELSLEEIVRTRRSALVNTQEEPAPGLLAQLGVRSYVVCPIFYQGRSLGTLTILSTRAEHHYRPRELVLFEELVRRAAIALENSRLYHEAQEAIRSRDEFLSIASHELKTPLTSLSLQLQILSMEIQKSLNLERAQRQGQEPDRVSIPLRALQFVSSAVTQSGKIANLLDELLDLTRIRLGMLNLSKESVDLGSLAKEVVGRFVVEATQKGIPILVDVPESVIGQWDPLRMEQVVSNLVSNAIKYGNGTPISVSVRSLKNPSKVRLVVSDRGRGVPTEMRDRIFERFERAGVSGRKISGLGLGLYICRQIVEAHGGIIRVESGIGKGSSFVVEVPLSVPEEQKMKRSANG
jgi:PAS domain S-box-containing protein